MDPFTRTEPGTTPGGAGGTGQTAWESGRALSGPLKTGISRPVDRGTVVLDAADDRADDAVTDGACKGVEGRVGVKVR